MAGENDDQIAYAGRATPIDAHVGAQIKIRRTWCNMSQESLGKALGVTFQQVQKYEHGTNRVGASRLFDIARVLNVQISYFFDGMSEDMSENQPLGSFGRVCGLPGQQNQDKDNLLFTRETLELIRAYYRIIDPAMRKRMFDFIKSLTPHEPAF